MFKRFCAILLIFASLCCAAGCGRTGGGREAEKTEAPVTTEAAATVPATEAASEAPEATEAPQEKFYVLDKRCDTSGASQSAMLETDDAYYFLCSVGVGSYEIWVSDKEYKDWMPLCAKPDCMHRYSSCNAKLEGEVNFSFWLYGDHIYYLTIDWDAAFPFDGAELWRMKLDGSDHELVLKPELPYSKALESVIRSGSGAFRSMGFKFTGKYAFIVYGASGITDDGDYSAKHVTDRYMIDLSRPEDGAVLMEFTDETGEPVPFYGVLLGKGESVYCFGFDSIYDPETETSEISNAALYAYDIPTRRGRKLCDLDFDPTDCFRSEYDGTLYFVPVFGSQYKEIYAVDLETGEVEKTYEQNGGRMLRGVPYKQYIFVDSAICDPTADTSEYGVSVYGMDGGLVQQRAFKEGESLVQFLAFMGDFAFGTLMSSDPEYKEDMEFTRPPMWYLDLNDIGTDRLMWRKWEP